MSTLNAITQPCYVLRPAQILRRLRFCYRRPQEPGSSIALPWGLSIRCRPNEEIGYSLPATLREPDSGFEANRGMASLARKAGVSGKAVKQQRLDEIMSPHDAAIGLWKIDVEGHELAALQGAQLLLRSRRIRDSIFEEFAPYPAPTHRLLEGCGYTILHFEPRLLGPKLRRTGPGYHPPRHSPPDFLATLDPPEWPISFVPCDGTGYPPAARRTSISPPRPASVLVLMVLR